MQFFITFVCYIRYAPVYMCLVNVIRVYVYNNRVRTELLVTILGGNFVEEPVITNHQ